MKVDGGKWAGTVPTGPGLWKGTNPVGVDEIGWKLFVLNSPNQFRPPPPPVHDSPERLAELAEVKNFKRTPFATCSPGNGQGMRAGRRSLASHDCGPGSTSRATSRPAGKSDGRSARLLCRVPSSMVLEHFGGANKPT